MDPADQIQQAAEDGRVADERFRRQAAILIGILAMLLAIAGLGGGNATKETVNANILASDTWAFYQAKNIRRTANQVGAEQLQALLLSQPDLSPEARADIDRRIASLRDTAARMQSEPETSDGMKELQVKARDYEARRERAQLQDPNFDYSQALFQIAIVLASVSIVATSRVLLGLAAALGIGATVLMLNGFLLLFQLPFG